MFTVMNTMVNITSVQQQIEINENKNTEQAQKLVTLNLKKQLIYMDLIISITKYYKPSSIQTSVNCGN